MKIVDNGQHYCINSKRPSSICTDYGSKAARPSLLPIGFIEVQDFQVLDIASKTQITYTPPVRL